MNVVKKAKTKPSEPCFLGDSPRMAPAAQEPQPQARIIEQDGAQAIVEISCTCGKIILLNCLCAPPGPQ